MSANLTLSAVSRVIESFTTPAAPEELVSEAAALLTFEGHEPDTGEIWAAIQAASLAGRKALVSARQHDGSLAVNIDGAKLLALHEQSAVPLRHATRADLLAHSEFMKRLRTEAAAGGTE